MSIRRTAALCGKMSDMYGYDPYFVGSVSMTHIGDILLAIGVKHDNIPYVGLLSIFELQVLNNIIVSSSMVK